MASYKDPTMTDKLMAIPNLSRGVGSAVTRLVTGPFSQGPKAKTTLKDVFFAMLRTLLSLNSGATEYAFDAPTEQNYNAFAKKNGFEPSTELLKSGLKLHRFGPKNAQKVVIYCHGGGYALHCSLAHLGWAADLQRQLSKSYDVQVLLPGYTVSYVEKYPTQLRQGIEALNWVISNQNKKPSDVVLAGDSAGGNMVLAMLSHMLHPHPDVSEQVTLSEPLAGAVLVSPWTKFGTDDDSVKRNATSDMIPPQAALRWSSQFLGSRPADNYSEPIRAEVSWWKGLDTKVKEILTWGGGGEVLIDSINAIHKKLEQAHPKAKLVVEPGAAHEEFIFDYLLGYKDSAGANLVESWIAALL